MVSIRTDITDLMLQNILTGNSFNLNEAINNLVTGSKLVNAKDNAANFSIATSLSTKLNSMCVIQDNTLQGIDMLQTSEDSLNLIMNHLRRLKEITIQAANGSYGEASRNALQLEANSIIEQIAQIREMTEYNGIKLFYTPDDSADADIEQQPAANALNLNLTNNIIATYSVNTSEADESASEDVSLDLDSNTSDVNIKPNTSLRTMSLRSAPAPDTIISDAEDFAANTTKTLTIDGKSYTITNRQGSKQTLSYKKNVTTGQITFLGSYFDIHAQADTSHDIIINGSYNNVYGGNLDDTIADANTSCLRNYIYGGSGNDTITLKGTNYCYAYGQDGDDTITSNTANAVVDGGNGNDVLNIRANTNTVYGSAGKDTVNIYGNNNTITGDAGDDTFNFSGSRSGNIVDGGAGTNKLTGSITNNTVANVVGGNAGIIVLAANVAQDAEINGITYNLKCTSAANVLYTIASNGEISFTKTAGTLTIRGDTEKAHKVKLASNNIIFYGGKLADTVNIAAGACTVYGQNGNDNITSSSWQSTIYGGNGADTIKTTSSRPYIIAGEGDDNITVSGYGGLINAGTGDDKVTLSGSAYANGVYSEAGTNTLVNNTTGANLINGFGLSDNAESVSINTSAAKEVIIDGKKYTIKSESGTKPFLYSLNTVTGETSFAGYQATITAENGVEHNVIILGYGLTFNGGNMDDTILMRGNNATVNGNDGNDTITFNGTESTINGGNGNDTININTSEANVYGNAGDDYIKIDANINTRIVNGGSGNDTYIINRLVKTLVDDGGDNIYYINSSSTSITGASGNDTFYVNGDNNTVLGGGGNDYFIINGSNNIVDGGTDLDNYVNNDESTDISNATTDPNSGFLAFTSLNETQEVVINGKTYTFKNNVAGINTLSFSLNTNTGIMTIDGSDFYINARSDESMLLNIKGSSNIITASSLDDRITVESGNNNIINGGNGNDTIILETENNSAFGGDGNDTLNVYASSNLEINGGNGDDTLNIYSNSSTNIKAESGNDNINLFGGNNNVTAGAGNNNITVKGDSNTVTAANGNNRLVIDSSDNTVVLGSGDNSVGVQGNNNIISAENAVGNINIYGNENIVDADAGDNNVTIKGNLNTFNSLSGNKNVKIIGNSNEITTADGNDVFDVEGNSNYIETSGGDNSAVLKGDSNTYQGGDAVDTIKITGDDNIARGGDSSDSFMVNRGARNILYGESGDRNTLINNGQGTSFTDIVDITPRPFNLEIKVDEGSGDDKFVKTTISFNLFDFSVDLTSSESAATSLDDIEEMMSNISSQLTNIGATINRLESAAEAQQVKISNISSSYSTIHDADIASVSSQYVRWQILQQAASTLLASSRNLKAENVMALIRAIR